MKKIAIVLLVIAIALAAVAAAPAAKKGFTLHGYYAPDTLAAGDTVLCKVTGIAYVVGHPIRDAVLECREVRMATKK